MEMDGKHYKELIPLSQQIYDAVTQKIADFCEKKYSEVPGDTKKQQNADYLFVAEEVSAFLMGKALNDLDPTSRLKALSGFFKNVEKAMISLHDQAETEGKENEPG